MNAEVREKSVSAPFKGSAPKASVKIRSILTTTDLSKGSLAGVRYAVELAKKVGAAANLLHVVELPPPSPMPGMRAVTFSLEESTISKRTDAHLRAIARRESKGDVTLTPILRSGSAFQGIIATARERSADLIVIATQGNTGAKRVLLGSIAERVVRHAPCPTLTIPVRRGRAGKAGRLGVKKILVPIDFSKTSEKALPWAVSLASEFEAELILLHVVEEFPIDFILGSGLMNEMIKPLMMQAEMDLNRVATSLSKSSGAGVSTAVRYGKPFEEISGAAEKLGAGMIALTTHGYTGLKNVWLGSVAERVVRHASCPVLVVRERKPGTR